VQRSAALTPLSRDHQHALDAALRLRRADPATVEAVIERFLAFWAAEGRRHFEIEEGHLLGALPADDPEWAPGVARVRADHAAIRAAATTLADGGGNRLSTARTTGERLRDHVRFEERELFTLLERRLAPEELERVGEAIARAERA